MKKRMLALLLGLLCAGLTACGSTDTAAKDETPSARRLLTGDITLRIHPAVAGAVNVAVLLGNAHRIVVPRVGLHIAVRNACLLRKVKRTVDIAHELRTSDLALRLVLAGGRTRIDDALIIQIFDKVFAPVSVQIGGKRCR